MPPPTPPENTNESIVVSETKESLKLVADPAELPDETAAFREGLSDREENLDELIEKMVDVQYDDRAKRENLDEATILSREGKAYIRGALGDEFIEAVEEFFNGQTSEGKGEHETVSFAKWLDTSISEIAEKKGFTDEQRNNIFDKTHTILESESTDVLKDYVTDVVRPATSEVHELQPETRKKYVTF